jgi:hypothetical protein
MCTLLWVIGLKSIYLSRGYFSSVYLGKIRKANAGNGRTCARESLDEVKESDVSLIGAAVWEAEKIKQPNDAHATSHASCCSK